jgi:glucose/arabinose dehydrogenase
MKRYLASALVLALCYAPGAALARDGLSDPIERDIQQGRIQVALQAIATGLVAPTWGISAPGVPGTLFVVDQAGVLWSINPATGAKTVFLDVSSLLVPLGIGGPGTYDERGFLGIAFHPDYVTNGLLYTYTSEPVQGEDDFPPLPNLTDPLDHQSVVREWRVADPANTAQSGLALDGSREVMRIDQPQFNHNGGTMNFGPDGMLYIALGDGGAADDQGSGHSAIGNGQDTTVIHGNFIRVNPVPSGDRGYTVPADNPFVARAGFLPEIWAYGFRNPFRFSFDMRPPHTLYVGDVGQHHIEEVDIVVKGGNYGWRIKEGAFLFEPAGPDEEGFVTAFSPRRPAGLIDPIAQYDHDDGVSVIGGFVYHGTAIPAFANRYVFADYSRRMNNEHGRLWYLEGSRIFEALDGPIGNAILGLGQDSTGEMYVLANETGTPFGATGVVYRIVSRCPSGKVGRVCDR